MTTLPPPRRDDLRELATWLVANPSLSPRIRQRLYRLVPDLEAAELCAALSLVCEIARNLEAECQTWASFALSSGKSPVGRGSTRACVAHVTLKTYAHSIREEEVDLDFADFEVRDGSERLHPAPDAETDTPNENAPDLSGRGRYQILEHETGLEPATPTLAISNGLRPRLSRLVSPRSVSAA